MGTQPLNLQLLFVLLCIPSIFFLVQKLVKARYRLPLPPGPPKLPIIGNLLQVPTSRAWETYHQWAQQYGSDIIQFDAAGTYVVILSSETAVVDLLEKRSKIYSDRPPAPMLCDLMGWDWHIGFLPYGDKWRSTRRVFVQAFHHQAAKQFRPQEASAVRQLLASILRDPEDYSEHLRHFTSSIILSIAYGLQIKQKDDPFVALAEDAIRPVAQALVPGAFLVDAIPLLKHVPSWFPGAGFKAKAKEGKRLALKMINEPYVAARKLIDSGDYIPSFVSKSLQVIEGKANAEEKEERIRAAAGSMYLAGTDTVTGAIAIFILAMVKFPETQRKAQEELDRMLPSGRLPEFNDEEDLPYLTAVIRESLRWETVAPTGLPRYIKVEDEYKGYRIPAGSVIVPNVWSILHDERLYPDPLTFNPDRFMKDGKLDDSVPDPSKLGTFGFGRRVCPGRHIAYTSTWLAIASILKVFHIGKAVDGNGNEIDPTFEPCHSVLAIPSPFRCVQYQASISGGRRVDQTI